MQKDHSMIGVNVIIAQKKKNILQGKMYENSASMHSWIHLMQDSFKSLSAVNYNQQTIVRVISC